MAVEPTAEILQYQADLQETERRTQRAFTGAIFMNVLLVVLLRLLNPRPHYAAVFLQALLLWSLVVMGYAFHSLLFASRQAIKMLRRRSFEDQVTGVFNYTYLDIRLREESERTSRYGGFTALLYIDLDKFKLVNDRYGHQVGNLVLGEIASTLSRKVRTCDILGRIGGDEFLAVLPQTDRREASVLANRLREAIEQYSLEVGEERHIDFVKASIGVAAYPVNGDTMEDVIAAADAAVYEAKRKGGNAVCVASEFVSSDSAVNRLIRQMRGPGGSG